MCSGSITRYSCTHEIQTYIYRCDDADNNTLQQLLPHRLVGRRILRRRLCDDCEASQRLQRQEEESTRQQHEARAKALLEYFRGERPWPMQDDEVRQIFTVRYTAGDRLHPWLNRGDERVLAECRNMLTGRFPEIGAALFQQMLDRQDRIDRTGVMLDEDRRYRLNLLFERGLADARRRRHAELRQRQQEAHRQLMESEQRLAGEQRATGGGEGRRQRTQSLPETRPNELEEIAQLSERVRVSQERLYRLENSAPDASGSQITSAADRVRAMFQANEVRMQEIQWLREQISFAVETLGRRREDVIQGLRDTVQAIEEARYQDLEPQPEPVMLQEPQQVEQQNGLYSSDPDWLRNFDDWCSENSGPEEGQIEVHLRRDINGWFQHLRTAPSQVRQDWLPFAERYRDAILEGDRCHYQHVPLRDTGSWQPMSFRHWCLESADPVAIRVSPISYIFIELLQGYEEYLTRCQCWDDVEVFRQDRRERVQTMRIALAIIPGAPLSFDMIDRVVRDSPSNREMLVDISHLCQLGHVPTDEDHVEREQYARRLQMLREEAIEVREGRLLGFTIERREEEQRERDGRDQRMREVNDEQSDSDSDDNMSAVDLLELLPERRTARAGSGNIEVLDQEQQDGNDDGCAAVYTSGLPASLQRQTASLHDETSSAEDLDHRSGRSDLT